MYSRQDKSFMKDPATAAARIYVGNLDQKVVEDDLRTLFSPYGKILGISVQRNFGFIQFDSEASAALAIQKELGTVFKGKKLNVRGAITGEGGKGNNNLKNIQTTPSNSNNNDGGNGSGVANIDEQINIKDATTPINNINNNKQDQQQSNSNQLYPRRTSVAVAGGAGPGPGRNNNNYRDRSPLNHQHHIHSHRQQQQQHYQGPPSQQQQQRSLYTFNNNDNRQQQQQQHINLMNKNKKADCNDCEIIVVAKSLTEYAEYIEDKLKQLGITVDLLFPNEDVPIGRVLANIASRGCLYAILVTPQNEQHHSLTLNILYGAPEEHRNMPTDDAINLIHKNFECYNNNINDDDGKTNNIILNKLLIKHSDTIQILLNLLIQNRQLNVIQYDQLIKYLQERRQLQLQYEQETITTTTDGTAAATEQANELQTRILNILNKTATDTINDNNDDLKDINNKKNVLNDIVTSVISKITNKDNTTSSSTSTSSAPPLLNDPSVQKALDSLLQADLLKNITINTNTNPNTNTNNDNINYGTNYSSNIRRF